MSSLKVLKGTFLRTSWGRPESTSQKRPLNVKLGHPFYVISRRPLDVRLGHPKHVRPGRPHDGEMGSSGDILGTLEGDVLGTSCGPIFAGWGNWRQDPKLFHHKHGSLIKTHVYSGYCCLKFNAIGSKQKKKIKRVEFKRKVIKNAETLIKELAYNTPKLIKKSIKNK